MAEIKEKPKEYFIPDNFIEEGRILSGRVKIRNLIEAVIMTLIVGIPVFIFTIGLDVSMQAKISIIISFCGPPAIVGVIGFNGDSIFYVLKCFRKWSNGNQAMLYNHRPKILREDPVEAMINEPNKIDLLIARYEKSRQSQIDKKANMQYVEGKDFVFEEDSAIDKFTKTKKQKETEFIKKQPKRKRQRDDKKTNVSSVNEESRYGSLNETQKDYNDVNLF